MSDHDKDKEALKELLSKAHILVGQKVDSSQGFIYIF
jgi:hypothetical protein